MTARSKPGPAPTTPADTALEPVPDQPGAAAEPAAPAATPITNMILADLVLRGGTALLRRAVDTSLLGRAGGAVVEKAMGNSKTGGKAGGKADKGSKGRSMGQTLLGTVAVRIATRSVPGAIIVGGGLLAKALYDRKKAKARKPD